MTVKLEKAAIVAGYLSPSDSQIELSHVGGKRLLQLSTPIWVCAPANMPSSHDPTRRLLELSDCYAHWTRLYGVLVWV